MSSSSFTVPVENRYFEGYVAESVHSFIEVLNQSREVVKSLKTVNFVRSRRS